MFNETIESIKDTIKHWYLPLILGIVFITIGVIALITPASTYLSLAFLFSASFFIAGIIEIVFSISHKKQLDGWGWTLASGILSTIIGILLIIHPQISIISLPLLVGFVILFQSTMAIVWSIELKRFKISSWGLLLFSGIVGIIFSFILLINPIFAGLTVAILTGIAMIAIGVFQIQYSIELKKLNNEFKKLEEQK